MRRFISVVVLAALVAVVLATTAVAREESKFSVIAHDTRHKQREHIFILKGKLLEPGNRSNVVGHFRAKFRKGGHLAAVFTFGDGKIKAAGNQNHQKVPIVGGTRRWNGAAGKLLIRNRKGHNARLNFDVVQ